MNELQAHLWNAAAPYDILALTFGAATLDFPTAVLALDLIAQHAQREQVGRDMRLARLLFDISFMLHSNRHFRARDLARCAAALASLDIRQPTMMYCIASQVVTRAHDFKVCELTNLMLAFATAGIRDIRMLEVVTSELAQRIDRCSPKEVGDASWSLVLLRFRADTLMAVMQETVGVKFTSAPLAQLIFALDLFGLRGFLRMALQRVPLAIQADETPEWCEYQTAVCVCGPFADGAHDTLSHTIAGLVRVAQGHEVSETELHGFSSPPHLGQHTARALHALGVQVTCGTLSTRQIPSWVVEARELIRPIFDVGSDAPDVERVALPVVDKDTYQKNMAAFGVDNFGKIGGRCLFNQLGIGKAEENWVRNAKQFIRSWAEGVGKKMGDWKANAVHRRIHVFSEYHLSSTMYPLAPLLEGTSFQLNGLRSDPETARRPYLCAVPLPISKWVDRTLCAEFQLITEVCDMLNRTGVEGLDLTSPEFRYSVWGLISLYLSEPSCVSCVGGMKQFLTLFPNVDLFVDCGSVVEPLMARTEIDLSKYDNTATNKHHELHSV